MCTHTVTKFLQEAPSWGRAPPLNPHMHDGPSVGGKLAGPSDPHRHDHIAVAVLLVGQRAHLPGRLLVLELDANGALGRRGEEIEQVLRIEADGERVALVFLLDRFLGLAVFGAGGGKLEALLGERELYRVRTLVGELRDAPQGIVQLAAFQNDGLIVLPRQHGLVVGKLTGEHARNQQPRPHLEEEVVVVAGKLDLAVVAGFSRKPLDLHHGLLGHEQPHFTVEACELVVGFGHGQAVAVGGYHRKRLGFEDQQAAIQRIARLLHGNGKRRLGDQGAQQFRRNLHQRVGKHRDGREVILRHAHHLVSLAVADDLDPVVFEQLEADLLLRQQTHQFEQFFSRDRGGAVFLDLGFARRADAQLEVGGRNCQPAALSLAEQVRQDGDGGLALHHALRQAQFVEQVKFLYAEFHRGVSSLFFGYEPVTLLSFPEGIKTVVAVASVETLKTSPRAATRRHCPVYLAGDALRKSRKTAPPGANHPLIAQEGHRCSTGISTGAGRASGGVARAYTNESSSLLRVRFRSLSLRRRVSILWIECRTVVWCLPPNCRPISGSDAEVSCLTRYMAIWRGKAMAFELLRIFKSCSRRPNCSPTRF